LRLRIFKNFYSYSVGVLFSSKVAGLCPLEVNRIKENSISEKTYSRLYST